MNNFIVTFVLGENVQEVRRFSSPGLAQQFIKQNKQSSQFVRGKLQLRTEKGLKHKKIL
jgi:hypothetical protein